ncbi:hypothetical protein FISHEDRAFT_74961 [Fistulina hepatica ATCC 64428]|uniref:Uncharacterized protein n=1 Tax=Fistulina hepatica ATCC 64428 TaxID=1128425 RepID=A0A0D7A7Z4_9AGAR|nr:hypothetical protein FISHEDRAFT_74961 [Fistulina hepatica ATCC 64428]
MADSRFEVSGRSFLFINVPPIDRFPLMLGQPSNWNFSIINLNSYANLSPIWSLISAHIIKGYTMTVAAGVFVTLVWEIMFDGLLCNGPPILQVFLDVFMQPRKYNILEGFGPWLLNLNICIPTEIVPLFILFALTLVFSGEYSPTKSLHDQLKYARSNTDRVLLFVLEDLDLSRLPSPVSLIVLSMFSLAQPPRLTE